MTHARLLLSLVLLRTLVLVASAGALVAFGPTVMKAWVILGAAVYGLAWLLTVAIRLQSRRSGRAHG